MASGRAGARTRRRRRCCAASPRRPASRSGARSSSIAAASRRPSATSPTRRSTPRSRASTRRSTASRRAARARQEEAAPSARARITSTSSRRTSSSCTTSTWSIRRAAASATRRSTPSGRCASTVEEIKSVFDAIEEDYFRERRRDVDFVGDRILRNLLGVRRRRRRCRRRARSIVAHDLSPADTAHLHRAACAAFVTDVGGKTSHTAILARAFEIPSVVGLDDVTEHVGTGDLLIVDGMRGEVIIRPTPEQCEEYRARGAAARAVRRASCSRNRDLPAETTDGARVRLYANVEIPEEVPTRARARRRGHRPLPHRVPLPRSHRPAARGGALHARARRAAAACTRSRPPSAPSISAATRWRPFAALGRRGQPGARPALDPPVPARARRSSRRSCAACCARRCTGACASCSR